MPETFKLSTDKMKRDLIEMVGPERVVIRVEEEKRRYRLHAPIVVFPSEEREIEQILGWAYKNDVRVSPQGGGTKDAFGHPGDGTDVILSLRNMSGILQHSAGDLTVTVLPGTTLNELQQALDKEGQFLPLDPAWGEQSTLGGIVAAGASGPKRAMYGSARDYLIASRICYPDGTLIRTGAKVVKNVAGYDMNKLFIGSMGTLGVFTELTFKIRPIPVYAGALVIHTPDLLKLRKLQEMLLDSQLEPSAVEWVNGRLGARIFGVTFESPILLVSFEDVERSVRFQTNWLRNACGSLGVKVQEQIEGYGKTGDVLSGLREHLPNSKDIPDDKLVISVKLLSMIAEVPDVYEFVQNSADEKGLPLDFHGGLYTGISRATIWADIEQQGEVFEWLRSVQSFVGRLNGRSVIEVAPRNIKESLNVWGAEAEDWILMKSIKHKIDPKRILNPGRFVGGI
ncbi:FAD-binding oxidoreductase [Paenibacillus rigui]|uniref:FAD-binding oxidoreductase n=1 Tax=Paenibacillus rigui TaxID=554312 RepID=A0A229UPT5_9BACL|nr:FAD-binding oxidoreductase [Paenibacillus rigui]OXM85496.1 FAD-binding oxidoreductase [Paenibacillus rigui]